MALFKSVEFLSKYRIKSFSKNSVYILSLNNFHTFKTILNQNDPVKYTTSKAAQFKFPNYTSSEEKELWYKNYVILGSISIFLLYFLCLREENDIDEMLKGNFNDKSYSDLLQLEIKLKYCETNGLPTEKLKNKIKELKKELGIKTWD